jgi:hypothetical protein
MHPRSIVLAIAILPALTTIASADEPTTTSQPTTASAITSPKSALKAYNLAMRNGDIPSMMALQHAVTDDELHIARCGSQSDLQVAALEQAARDKFGDAGEKQIAAAIEDEDDAAIDSATEKIKGSHAKILFPGQDSPTLMVRAGDGWAVDIAATLRESRTTADDLCVSIIRRGSVAKVTAQEIVAGQFNSISAAVEAIKSRLKEN